MKQEGYYTRRIDEIKETIQVLRKKFSTVSNFRLAAIAAGAVLFYFLLKTSLVITIVVWIVVLLGFYRLVKYHEKLDLELSLAKTALEVIRNEVDLLKNGTSVYSGGERYSNEKHAYSTDLDIFGEFSLYKMINRARTDKGQQILAACFLKQWKKAEIEERQQAIRELQEKQAWFQLFQASLFEVEETKTGILQGLQVPPKIRFEGLIHLYRFIRWIILPCIAASFYFGSTTTGLITLFGITAFHFWLAGQNRKETEPYFKELKGHSRDLAKYEAAVAAILEENWESELLIKQARKLKEEAGNGENPIREFQVISNRIDMKNNQFAAFFLYILSPFDLVELIRLKKWIREHPSFFSVVFNGIGNFEALGSLGTFAFNHNQWHFPQIKQSDRPFLEGKKLGHPLISGSVSNDFSLSADNRLTLITGSNMSGKSTFLRTIGCNILLAYAGAPCFAEKLILSEGIELFTYMRIRDSLQENASTFKAEIERIRLLLHAMEEKPLSLLLVDEMLRGTNSEDKLKGSLAFLKRVAEESAYALVATHDLRTTDLAATYPQVIKTYFFEYNSKNGELTFDYHLKPGVCTSFNASELLRRVGLDV
jgi:ABC-type multidrug transport system fused ATPase/permease subunit